VGKKTKDEFKTAFKAIKKPKRPDAVSGSDKDRLEKAVDAATSYTGVVDLDKKTKEVLRLATEIQNSDAGYLVDLIAYKSVKHMDEGSDKKPVWAAAMPPDAYKAALLKIIPRNASDQITRKVLEKALLNGGFDNPTKGLIFDRDPDAFIEAVLDKWQDYDTDKTRDLQGTWAQAVPGDAAAQRNALGGALARGDKGLIAAISANATVLTTDDYKAVAEDNEALFVTEILPGLKKKNEFHKIMADAEIRAMLKEKAPAEWQALVDTTPMLTLLDNVEKSFAPKKGGKKNPKPPKPAEVVSKIFDSIVTNDGMELGYRSVSEDSVRVILSGGTKEDKEARDKKKAIVGDSFPDIPSTQCHSLLELTETLMGAYPGVKPTITQGECKDMALTAKLATIPGVGLLDKSFGGNVFDDNGASLDQVLFTGEGGMKSHTWIVVDGVDYDPVLGTRGNEVRAAVAAEFKWKIDDRLAVVGGGLYIVKETNSPLKVKANQMGFSTGYRLTANPSKFLTADECEKQGLPPPPKADAGAETSASESV
jgi:hypothetical protein